MESRVEQIEDVAALGLPPGWVAFSIKNDGPATPEQISGVRETLKDSPELLAAFDQACAKP